MEQGEGVEPSFGMRMQCERFFFLCLFLSLNHLFFLLNRPIIGPRACVIGFIDGFSLHACPLRPQNRSLVSIEKTACCVFINFSPLPLHYISSCPFTNHRGLSCAVVLFIVFINDVLILYCIGRFFFCFVFYSSCWHTFFLCAFRSVN